MTETTEKKADPRTVTLKWLRASFTDGLVEKQVAQGVDDAKPKFGTNFILEQTEDADQRARKHFADNRAKCLAAIEAACEAEWGNKDKWKQIQEDQPKRVCFRKGDRFKNQDTGEVYKGYAGNMGLVVSTPAGGQKRPKMYNSRKKEITVEQIDEVVYGGVYCDAIVSFFGTTKGGNGVFAVVEAIRSFEEGAAMGGGWNGDASAFDDEGLDDDADSFAGGGASTSTDEDPFG